jgi:ClpP class serine protease
MALGANRIVMTKQATLGPIDPSLTSPLNPVVTINGQTNISPVSVEDIKAYLSLAKDELGIQKPEDAINILLKLSEKSASPCVRKRLSGTNSNSDARQKASDTPGI